MRSHNRPRLQPLLVDLGQRLGASELIAFCRLAADVVRRVKALVVAQPALHSGVRLGNNLYRRHSFHCCHVPQEVLAYLLVLAVQHF